MRKLAPILLALALALSLAACGGGDKPGGGAKDGPTADANAPLHEQLLAEADIALEDARHAADMGAALQAEYTYGLALAPVSSLRFCVDNIIWLKGEGETVGDIVGVAPYDNWNDIVAAGLGSPMPSYFEGLLFKVQGKDAEASEWFNIAATNPLYSERDFYYLKDLSVEELYAIHDTAVAKELAILDEYTPRTALLAEHSGAEYSPLYHMALLGDFYESGDKASAYGCALNAVMSMPKIPDYYGTAVLLAMDTGKTDDALLLLNQGLYAFPDNGELNYFAATVSYAQGDTDSAKAYLQKATADTSLSPEYAEKCAELSAQMGG